MEQVSLADLIQSGGLLAFAGAVLFELRKLREVLEDMGKRQVSIYERQRHMSEQLQIRGLPRHTPPLRAVTEDDGSAA